VASTITVVLMAVTTSGLLSVPASLSQNILAQSEFLYYENKVFGFSIQYPADWKKEEQSTSKSSNINIVVSFSKHNKNQLNSEADLYIRTEDFLGRNTTLVDLVQLQKAYTSSLLAVSSFNETRPIIGDKPAWQLEYTFKGIGGTIRQGINGLFVNDNIGYSIVFTADKKTYEKYFPLAQKMVDSFLYR
jgi:PsbP-like protein